MLMRPSYAFGCTRSQWPAISSQVAVTALRMYGFGRFSNGTSCWSLNSSQRALKSQRQREVTIGMDMRDVLAHPATHAAVHCVVDEGDVSHAEFPRRRG